MSKCHQSRTIWSIKTTRYCVLLYQCNRTPYSKLHSNLAVPETSKIIAPMQCYKTFKIFAGFYYVQGCQRDTVNQTMRWAILYVFMMVKIRLWGGYTNVFMVVGNQTMGVVQNCIYDAGNQTTRGGGAAEIACQNPTLAIQEILGDKNLQPTFLLLPFVHYSTLQTLLSIP